MFLAYWVHDLKPYLIQFTDTIGVRYYGLAYVLGFLGAAGIMSRYSKAGKTPLTPTQISDLIVWLVVGVMVGGRLGYFFFYHPDSLLADPLALFRVWEGGMAFHGGVVGVALAIAGFAYRVRVPFLHIADVICSVACLGLLFGRIANFINGELWGKISTVPWAVIFPASEPLQTDVALIAARHPSQLYEAFLEGLVLFVYLQFRFWRSDVVQKRPGQLAGEFLVGYGLARIFCELFREPDATLIFGISRGTFYSILLVLAGVILLITRTRRPTTKT
ncbi:MAG TPA: prolipoprotein diacylglyceryl transferase [Opitutaceae bacterium]|nr:prolipoprotein diacylglyceryl transferase [Opitutaceae bacterium]